MTITIMGAAIMTTMIEVWSTMATTSSTSRTEEELAEDDMMLAEGMKLTLRSFSNNSLF